MHIRRAQPSDASSLSRICLLTADAGKSAESQHTIPELPGLVYAAPYVQLPYASGFVLVTDAQDAIPNSTDSNTNNDKIGKEERILGYTIFAYDTAKFQETQDGEWYPPLREKYPLSMVEETGEGSTLTEQDRHYIKMIHNPDRTEREICSTFSPAHMVRLSLFLLFLNINVKASFHLITVACC